MKGKEKLTTCPNCGSDIKEGSSFCEVCGTRLSGVREISDEIQQEVEQEQLEEASVKPGIPSSHPQGAVNYEQNSQSSGSRSILTRVICVIVLVLIGGGVWFFFNNKTIATLTSITGINDDVSISGKQFLPEQQLESEQSAIKARVEDIFAKMIKYLSSRDYDPNFEQSFLSAEYNDLYNEASEIADKIDDLLMDSNPWTGQDADRPSIQVVNIDKVSDNKARVEILYKPYSGMDRMEQRTLFLVKENGIWLIDDFREEPYYSSVKGYLKKYIEENQNKPINENEEDNSVDDAISNENERENDNNAIITEGKYDEEILMKADNMPEFADGGMKGLMIYLKEAINYPPNAKASGIEGRVTVQFIVNLDGSISDAYVLRGVNPDLDKEALRVINSMPKWKPGTNRGETVRVRYTVPVNFRLN